MARKISEIYTEYKIMPNLQDHMLRVAAVASLICDNFTEPLPKEEIIAACLVHDIGNIIKFQLEYFPEFNEPEGIEYWKNVQKEYIKKYGEHEHKATVQIVRELGLSDRVVNIVDKINFSLLCSHSVSDDMISKIPFYADLRVDPHGVVSYDEHMEEGKKRYQNRKGNFPEEKLQILFECGREVEEQIFSKCKIKPESITNEAVTPLIPKMKDFVIK